MSHAMTGIMREALFAEDNIPQDKYIAWVADATTLGHCEPVIHGEIDPTLQGVRQNQTTGRHPMGLQVRPQYRTTAIIRHAPGVCFLK